MKLSPPMTMAIDTSESSLIPGLARNMKAVIGDNFLGHVRRGSGERSSGLDIVYRPKKGGLAASQEFTGKATAKADLAGVVRRVESTNRGVVVEIDHGNQGGKQLVTTYRHLREPTVREGEEVAAGAPIGRVSFDPKDKQARNHLHYEMRWGGKVIDPQPIFALANRTGLPRDVSEAEFVGALNVGADRAKVAFAGPRGVPTDAQGIPLPLPGKKKPPGESRGLLIAILVLGLLASRR